jgi:hypothetical protein
MAAAALAAAPLAACGDDDPFTPSLATVQGTYNASRFTATSDATGTVNLLSMGATVHVVLEPDGTTTGHLSVPDLGEGAVEADLTGTWTLSGNIVTFSQTADTFIRDVEFTAAQNSLDAEGTFEGTTVHLTLSKTG